MKTTLKAAKNPRSKTEWIFFCKRKFSQDSLYFQGGCGASQSWIANADQRVFEDDVDVCLERRRTPDCLVS